MLKRLSITESLLLCIGFFAILFFSSYRLFASPETWMDEGLIIQTAIGILATQKASLPVAPSVYEPMGYITTGFPVTLTLAGVFAIFGVSLEAARLVMLMFLLSLYAGLFLYARKAIGGIAAWLGFFLLVFFGPLYGNGRNVLGEIPGLLMILISLWPLIASTKPLTVKKALWAGAGAGLAVATKPIFILFIPALLFALLLRQKELELKKFFIFGVLGAIIPIAVWIFFQFDQITLGSILRVYANPHDIDIGSAIGTNIKRLGVEIQPLYFSIALAIWTGSYALRRWYRESVPLAEEALLFFSILVFLAYLRTTGYYRYFFPAQVFVLLYLPQSLWYLVGRRNQLFSRVVIVGVCALILYQAYETTFHSWTAIHYSSTRTEALEQFFATLPRGEEIFVYQAPEVVPFAGKQALYQYVEITPSLRVGEQYRYLVPSGTVERIITPNDFFIAHHNTLFMHYTAIKTIDSYTIAIRKDR